MRGVRAPVLLLLVFVTACSRHEPVPPPVPSIDSGGATPVATTMSDAAVSDAGATKIGLGFEGGTVEGDNAKMIVPEGALSADVAMTIKRVPDAELPSWPRGTALGFVFEPAATRFKTPVKLELPHFDVSGEVMCEMTGGERQIERFDTKPGPKPFRMYVVELPKRCAVYSLEHMKARKASEEKAAEKVTKLNSSFKWESKGKICDPHEFVRPNAGKNFQEPPGLEGCPAGMAKIPNRDACVDRWEAHVVDVLDDGTEHTWSPFFNPAGVNIRAKSAPGALPQGYISALQSQLACKAANKRLCRDDEWVAACKGAKGTQYPYGNEEKRGTCNDSRPQHPAMQYLESHDLSVFTKLEHPCINQIADSLLPSGSKKECKTTEGAYDMVGNLHEWTADEKGHFRGGYYVDTWLNGHGCDYVTTRHEARYWDYSTGFRCCADLPK
jgi:hypothetical protein